MNPKYWFLGPLAVFFGLVLFPLLSVYASNVLHISSFYFPVLFLLGIVFVCIGIVLWLYCVSRFLVLGHGTPVPTKPPKKLVVTGIYHRTRNPIYVAFVLILFGEFLILGRIVDVIPLLFTIMFMHAYVVRIEEPVLKKRFGKNYEEYCKRVPRWI